jgi:hypothetical protein
LGIVPESAFNANPKFEDDRLSGMDLERRSI